jgi:hypothetical protein
MANEMYVLIPTAANSRTLRRTLELLVRCERPGILREVVVVENGSKGEAEQTVSGYAGQIAMRYMHVRIPSKSNALNEALRTLPADGLVYFMDDDIRPHPAVLVEMAKAAEGVTGGSFFGGPFGVDYEQPPARWLMRYLPRSARGWTRDPAALPGVQPFLGFHWAAFAGDVLRAGGFDIGRGPGSDSGITVGDETILQRRMIAMGMSEVYVPGARVWHYVPTTRCSPAWAIERNYRHGVAKGTQRGGDRPAVAGIPLWILRRYAQGLFRGALDLAMCHAEARFRARHRHAFNRGLLAGARQWQQMEKSQQERVIQIEQDVAALGHQT